ncbi:MAG: hypothetical protein KA182_00790, partial [Propionivibrio sp.]|nr:hypothetical protein [Propionivibrio sp.]
AAAPLAFQILCHRRYPSSSFNTTRIVLRQQRHEKNAGQLTLTVDLMARVGRQCVDHLPLS